MEHLSEVVKILDAALMHDTSKAVAYANLLASKLDEDSQPRQARMLRSLLAKLPTSQVAPAYAQPRIPKDAENSLALVDYTPSEQLVDADLVLHPYVESRVNEFLDAVRNHDKWVAHGIAPSNRLLIYGPPGTGKTSIAAQLASQLGLPLIVSRSDALVSSLLGQTSRNIRNIFQFTESAPCLLFLDEFDALAKNRNDSREIGELQRVVIALLQNMDALPPSSVLVAATNHSELLDPAVWRRFDYTVKVELPEEASRRAIWTGALGGFAPRGADLERLVELSVGMSGAAIKAAANDMCRVAIMTGEEAPPLSVLLRRLARVLWYDSYERFETERTEMAALREWAPDVFTVRTLGELFGVSTRQVSNATKGFSHARVRTDNSPAGAKR